MLGYANRLGVVFGVAAVTLAMASAIASDSKSIEQAAHGAYVAAINCAFERYTYKSTDTDKKSGAVTTDTGKGINIFRHGSDGRWQVAIDGWSSDRPAGR